MNSIIKKIITELIRNADEKTRIQGEKFSKEKIKIHGLKSAQVREISKTYYKQLSDKAKSTVFALCEELWKTGFIEETGIACMWSYNVRKQYVSEDFKVFERWVNNYVTNWAACDALCNHTVGTFIEMYPSFLSGLKKWARSKNR
jgi:3-methyladenine DNA glycosylase AlkD